MPSTDSPWTRRGVLGAGVGILSSLAGCPDSLGEDAPGTTRRTRTETTTTRTDATPTQAPALHVSPDSRLHGAVQAAAAAWNRNPAPGAYWDLSDAQELGTDAHLADHFAADRGLELTGKTGRPPVLVAVSSLEPETSAVGVAAGNPDLFTHGTEQPHDESVIAETLPDERARRVTSRPLAIGGQAFFLSPALAEAGVTALTVEEVRGLYQEELTNWAAVGGPDREVYAISGSTGSPNPRIETAFFEGLELPDTRIGLSRGRFRETLNRADAITYLPPGFLQSELPAVDVVVDGTRSDVGDPGYPSTVVHEAHAWDEFDPREAAFLDMLRSAVGRDAVATLSPVLHWDWSP